MSLCLLHLDQCLTPHHPTTPPHLTPPTPHTAVQVVVGCAKPRFFAERSNLFEVHTEVSVEWRATACVA